MAKSQTGRNQKVIGVDLFGEAVTQDALLRDKYIEPPFSVLDTRQGNWQKRKRLWQAKGIKSEVGRDAECLPTSIGEKYGRTTVQGTSIFDPVLCELMYRWFCPEGGRILDFFAGGSVRGIVANYLGYEYTGIDLRKEQIEANIQQGSEILLTEGKEMPQWIAGDSNVVLDQFVQPTLKDTESFDLLFTCPPYLDLEVYSDDKADLSTMDDKAFDAVYSSIIAKGCKLLKRDSFAVIVVGEVRGSNGFYRGFIEMTKRAFEAAGLGFYNDIVLLNSIGTASVRASNSMRNKKVVKVHQNVLVFYKGNVKNIQRRFPDNDAQVKEEVHAAQEAVIEHIDVYPAEHQFEEPQPDEKDTVEIQCPDNNIPELGFE